jgi:hypothetical protein
MFTRTCLRKAVIPFDNPLLGVAGKPLMSTAWLCPYHQLHHPPAPTPTPYTTPQPQTTVSAAVPAACIFRADWLLRCAVHALSQINTVVCARNHLHHAADGLWTHGCVAACMGRRLCRVVKAWVVIYLRNASGTFNAAAVTCWVVTVHVLHHVTPPTPLCDPVAAVTGLSWACLFCIFWFEIERVSCLISGALCV